MAQNNLLGLPTELLDRIFSYLDWDRSVSLIPRRSDIHTVSLTCKHLRNAALPLVFRNVTLSLRWQDGVLLEPALYQLRHERPDLAQHIRCVYVATRLGYRPRTKYGEQTPNFRIPDDVDDWLDTGMVTGPDCAHYAKLGEAHRKRVELAVNTLCTNVESSEPGLTTQQGPSDSTDASPPTSSKPRDGAGSLYSAEENIRKLVNYTNHAIKQHRSHRVPTPHDGDHFSELEASDDQPPIGAVRSNASYAGRFDPYHGAGPAQRKDQRTKLQVDALATLMLCLPATLNELVFEAGVHGWDDQPWYLFGMFLTNASMQVFGHRLESLTMATGAGSGDRRLMRPQLTETDIVDLTPSAVANLTTLRRLVLASTSAPPETFNIHQLHVGTQQFVPWTSPTLHIHLTVLEFWNTNMTDIDLTKTVAFIKPFAALKMLAFQHLSYATRGVPSRLYPLQGHLGEPVLLTFAIDLRRAIPPCTTLSFHSIAVSLRNKHTQFSASALRWVMDEAVPVGAEIDFQREERLSEDFESFQVLWEAEDGERGREAAGHRGSVDLVDAAMCSRWKQFENVRRDGGEWSTM